MKMPEAHRPKAAIYRIVSIVVVPHWQKTAEVAEAAGATVVVGEWRGEIEHWAVTGEHILSLGYTHAFRDNDLHVPG